MNFYFFDSFINAVNVIIYLILNINFGMILIGHSRSSTIGTIDREYIISCTISEILPLV